MNQQPSSKQSTIYLQSQYLQAQQEKNSFVYLSHQELEDIKINEGYKIATWSKGFNYDPIDTSKLHSVFIDENEDFQNCIQLITEFNEELIKSSQTQKDINNGPQRNQFYNLLNTMLLEVIFTRNRIMQKEFASKVNAWAIEQSTLLNQGAKNFKPFDYKSIYKSVVQLRPLSSITKVESTKHLSTTRPISAAFSSIPMTPQNQVFDTILSSSSSNKLLRPFSSTGFRKMRPITATTRPDSAALSFGKDRPDTASTIQDSQLKVKPKFASQDYDQYQQQQQQQQQQQPSQIDELEKVESETKYNIIEDLNEGSIEELPEEILNLPQEQLTKFLQMQIEYKDKKQRQIQQIEKVNYEKYLKQLSPYEQIQEIERDYKLNHRTKHSDCDPPSYKLKEYKTKHIGPTEEEEEAKKKQEEDKIKKQNESVVTYPIPKLQLNIDQQQNLQQQQLLAVQTPIEHNLQQQQQQAGQEQPVQDGQNQQEQPQQQGNEQEKDQENQQEAYKEDLFQNEEEKKTYEKKKMIPLVKNYLEDKNSKETFKRNLTQKFEQRGTFLFYEPSKDPKEMRMEQLFVKNRHLEVQKKRECEEYIQLKEDWSRAKSRFETELNKKQDYQTDASKFRNCAFKHRVYSAKELRKIDKQTLNNNFLAFQQRKQEQGDGNENPELEEDNWFLQGPQKISQFDTDKKINPLENQKNQNNLKQQGIDDENDDNDGDGDGGIDIEEDEEDAEDDFDIIPAEGMRPNRPQSYYIPKQSEFKDFSKINPKLANTKQVSKLETFNNLENEISKSRLNIVKRIHSAAIGIKKPGTEKDPEVTNPKPSLSIYSRSFQKTMSRPFSAVLSRFKPKTYQDQQIEEIESIKEKLSQNKINIPISTLMSALLVPDLGVKQIQKDTLPNPGLGLMKNPFFVAKKKKKGKKKKSKKSKK